MKLIGIGDAVVDIYQDQHRMYPGGSVVNVAVMARRCGAEHTAWLGLVGDDAAGQHLQACLVEEGVDISRHRVVRGSTGAAYVTLDAQGDRCFTGTNHATRVQSLVALTLNQDDLTYLRQFDVVHSCVSLNTSLERELSKLHGQTLSFDFSSPEYWTSDDLERICPLLGFAFFSGSDLSQAEIRTLVRRVHDLGVEVVGVTRAEAPAYFSYRGTVVEQPVYPATVVDTMGAGDSFIAAFLTHYLTEQAGLAPALAFAARYAAEVCGYHGAFGYGKQLD
ncbi:PfkB family carbohydrate kinase [Pseudomonas sp. JZ134]|uniref:PfkB family carbohydrate kinase n=1 Tax=Pseudomonas sp. JZ134 TaxID=2806615 RepID=UPI003DA0D69B